MRFECADCHKTFLHAAKLTSAIAETDDFLETYVCPFCKLPNIQEVVELKPVEVQEAFQSISFEPKTAPEENSVINNLLAQGYQIVNYFAKSVNMIKVKEAKQ